MKKTFLKFALMGMVAASAVVACNDDEKTTHTTVTVTGVAPTNVAVGDTITITGTNLDQATAVALGTSKENYIQVLKASFVSGSATSIKVKVPAGVTFPAAVVVTVGETAITWQGGLLTELETATPAQEDALDFLICANGAYTAHPDETSAEYQQAIGGCLQGLDVASLSFDAQGKPNNDYTIALFAAIAETVTAMYTGQTAEAIAESIAGIQYMILSFYQEMQQQGA